MPRAGSRSWWCYSSTSASPNYHCQKLKSNHHSVSRILCHTYAVSFILPVISDGTEGLNDGVHRDGRAGGVWRAPTPTPDVRADRRVRALPFNARVPLAWHIGRPAGKAGMAGRRLLRPSTGSTILLLARTIRSFQRLSVCSAVSFPLPRCPIMPGRLEKEGPNASCSWHLVIAGKKRRMGVRGASKGTAQGSVWVGEAGGSGGGQGEWHEPTPWCITLELDGNCSLLFFARLPSTGYRFFQARMQCDRLAEEREREKELGRPTEAAVSRSRV